MGADVFSGGAGSDTFTYQLPYDYSSYGTQETLAFTGGADTILDFDASTDRILMWVTPPDAFEREDYSEAATNATSIEQAVASGYRHEQSTGRNLDVIFLYNANQDRGYLVMDTDGNGSFESGIILEGAGQASDFDYINLA